MEIGTSKLETGLLTRYKGTYASLVDVQLASVKNFLECHFDGLLKCFPSKNDPNVSKSDCRITRSRVNMVLGTESHTEFCLIFGSLFWMKYLRRSI